jgi:TonB-dependent receptor
MSNSKSIFTFIILFITASFLFAQSGSIQGYITDEATGDVLVGANVSLEGTSLGASTDLDGKYIINKVPVGSYTVAVRYIGYLEKETTIEVTEGETTNLTVALQFQALEGEVIVVQAQAEGQLKAINAQLSSNTITNVVAAEKIHELPDADAATALSRLPGLSLMNGDQVVIRGIEAKQNLVLVNGIQLPSTDVNNRATNLGFFSANMLSSIEVIKVVTPDMDANTIGGVVNLRLREAPSGFHYDVLTQGGLNHQERSLNNYRFWLSVSNRFFNDNLGVFLQGNADRSEGGQDRTSAGYTNYDVSQPYGRAPYRMDNFTFSDQQNVTSSYGGSLIMDYKLSHGNILLQNTISFGENDNASNNFQMDFANNRIIYGLNRDKYDRKLISNALQTEYTFGTLKTEFTLSHSYSDRSTAIRYGDVGDATNFANASNAVYGRDADGNPISYANLRTSLTPDDVYSLSYDTDDYKGADISDWAVLREVAFDQHIYNSQLDFSLPVSFSDNFSSTFKMGGKFIRTTRSNDLNRWYKRTGDEDFYANVTDFIEGKTLSNNNQLLFTDIQNTDYDRGQYYLDGKYDFDYAFDIDKLDDFYTQARAGWGQAKHLQGTVSDDFDGAELFAAGYLMGTFNIGPKLTLIGGGRYEHYNMDYKATNFYVTHPVDGNGRLMDTLNTVNRNDDTFFPNVQTRYKFTDWADVRLAYSETVSRPDYRAILPKTLFSPGPPQTIAGNPKLKPAISKNLDAYVSFYNNEIGLFTIGGFYKRIQDVFFQTNIVYINLPYYDITFPDSSFWASQTTPLNPDGIAPPTMSESITTWLNNPHPAYIKGLEFEWQTNFWYLPKPLNSMILNVNYTRVWSEMDYQQLRNIPIDTTYIDPVTGRRVTKIIGYNTIDTVRTARLLNQGNNILNVALGFDYKGFSSRISFNMQGNVITTVGGRPEDDQFTGNIYKWDFTIKQKLPIDGLSISLSGINIFHNATKTYRNFRRVVDGPVSDYELSTAYSPRRFELNLRYNM